MMTLEEAKELANEVNKNCRSYVQAAKKLSEFVLSLESVRPKFQLNHNRTCRDPMCPSCDRKGH